MNNKALVVNFYGGPSCGKSTMATRLFSELKSMGVKCEYITEYAKEVTYAEDWDKLSDQLYITAKQHRKMNIVADKVDVLITDSPILLGLHYSPVKYFNGHFGNLVSELYNSFDNLNIMLNRKKKYQAYGRTQTEEEARNIDTALRKILDSQGIKYVELDGNFESIPEIVDIIQKKLESKSQ